MSRTIDPRKVTDWFSFQARFYHLWRDDYDNPLIERVADGLAPPEHPATILDVGCGSGLFALGLARSRKNWSVEGVDGADGMVAIAGRQAHRLGVRNASFRRSDVTTLPYPAGSFQGAVAAGLFPYLPEWKAPLAELFRVLAPGGRLAVVELNRSEMSAIVRGFVAVMILGQRLVSTILPRFRFARPWNVEASTVDPGLLAAEARAAGFNENASERQGSSLVLWFEKEAQ